MPVVVTGASGRIGRVAVPALARRGEVRAVVRSREHREDLRSTGAKVAVCHLEDDATLRVVMDGAHTLVHLAGGVDVEEDEVEEANAGTVREAIAVATDADVKRVILVSSPGARVDAPTPYLRAKGAAEEAVAGSGLEHVILRTTHVYGVGQWWWELMRLAGQRRFGAVVVGTGTQRLAPIHVNDLVSAIVAADDRAASLGGTFGLQAPDVVSADDVVDLVVGRRRRKVHAPDARRARQLLGVLTDSAFELLSADSLADAPDAAAEFGLSPKPLAEGLAELAG